jgi:non-ribosomal peptide synthetase-like protein
MQPLTAIDQAPTPGRRSGSFRQAPVAHTDEPAGRSVAPTAPVRRLHQFFERTGDEHPSNLAVVCGPDRLTYADLDVRANRLAHHLARLGVKPGDRVGLLMERSVNTYVSLLAVLKAGAAFVPLDVSFPPERVAFIAGDASLALLLTTSEFGAVAAAARCPALALDAEAAAIAAEPKARPAAADHGDSLCYVIYTSGTTGRPKGVAVNHSSACNFIAAVAPIYGVTAADRVYQGMTLAFDFSVEEVWPAFRAGATVVAGPTDHRRLGSGLTDFLIEQGITVLACVPTLLATLDRDVPTLRTLLVGGEACPADLVGRWARPGRRMLNTYGPTETTVTATWAELVPGRLVTIGRPLPTYTAHVLDAALRPVQPGTAGELCIGGPGVAVGYVNRPELTAEKFVPDPFSDRSGARLYRTGDLAAVIPDGEIEYLGRIDTQVKIRGYRIELAEIEAVLLEAGPVVNAVVAVVPGEAGADELAAYVVPRPGTDFAALRQQLHDALRQRLPAYMVPAYVEPIDAVPMLPSQKADRSRLPRPTGPRIASGGDGEAIPPATPLEEAIAAAWAKVFGHEIRSVEDHFFLDCGGHSLFAARVVSELRSLPELGSLGLADLYARPTIRGLAALATPVTPADAPARPPSVEAPRKGPFLATVVQTVCLLFWLVAGGAALYLLLFELVPALVGDLGPVELLLATPLLYAAGLCGYGAGSVLLAVVLKKLLIGRYGPRREPVWGGFYVRNWIVHQAVRLIPWRLLEGTVFQCAVLRALGARIGRRVHVHRGVNLLDGGWDLLELGDDVTLSRDATVRLVDYDDGQVVVGPVVIGGGCTLEPRSGVGPDTVMEPESRLTAHAYLAPGNRVPRGQSWSGAPARPAGDAPPAPPLPAESHELSPLRHGVVLCSARLLMGALGILPLAVLALVLSWLWGIDTATAGGWAMHPSLDAGEFVVSAALIVGLVPLLLAWRCLSMRMLGRVREGVIPRWSYDYVRVQLKSDILDWANDWLDGTLFWPMWLRGAGMKVGGWCEISRIHDTIPELTEIGTASFLAGGIYLGSPSVHRGTVTLAWVTLGDAVFLGNYAVVAAGQSIPDGVLVGVGTVADDALMRPGTAWFGVPPFELPRREVVAADVGLTLRPSWPRVLNRVFWECLRFALPLVPAVLALGWLALLGRAAGVVSFPTLVLAVVPALDLGFVAGLCLTAVAMKWLLLGRVRPDTHPLWSSWSCRWDFNYTVVHALALDAVAVLEGTVWLNWFLRALGVRVGRNVALYDVSSYCTDPDMLEIGDGATVNGLYQAHTFEDRVLKLGRIVIDRRATVESGVILLYETTVGDGARVAAHSVVMKGERLEPGRTYAGCPTRRVS